MPVPRTAQDVCLTCAQLGSTRFESHWTDREMETSWKLGGVGRGEGLARMGPRAAPGDGLCCIRRRFGTKCAGCAQGISPSDLVRKARSKVFHLNCFTCMVCNKQLSTGEELYVIDENKFVCKDDYLSSSSLKEGSLNSGRGLCSSCLAQPGALDCALCVFSAPAQNSPLLVTRQAGLWRSWSWALGERPGVPSQSSGRRGTSSSLPCCPPIQEPFPSCHLVQFESGQFPPFLSSRPFLPALGGH